MEYFKIDRRGRRTDGGIVFLRRNPKHLISSANGWTDGRTDGMWIGEGGTHSRERGEGEEGAPWEVAASITQTDRQRDAAPLFILD